MKLSIEKVYGRKIAELTSTRDDWSRAAKVLRSHWVPILNWTGVAGGGGGDPGQAGGGQAEDHRVGAPET